MQKWHLVFNIVLKVLPASAELFFTELKAIEFTDYVTL